MQGVWLPHCLNPLRCGFWQVCAHDIEEVCVYERDSLDNIEGFDARVITCLQVGALSSDICKAASSSG